MSASGQTLITAHTNRYQLSRQAALLLISAATLSFEINLTRIFSVTQFYHFAFMVVSIALLGMGASGTFLSIFQSISTRNRSGLLSFISAGTSLSIMGAYLLINHLPFDSYSLAIKPSQALILTLHYLALATPFFMTGMIVSLMLSNSTVSSNKTYALNLVGSALGCIIALLVPSRLGGEGMIALSALLAAGASLLFTIEPGSQLNKSSATQTIRTLFLITLILLFLFLVGFRPFSGRMPKIFQLSLSPYKGLSYVLHSPNAKILDSKWNSHSKVDLVESPSLHSVPGLSFRYLQPLPSIHGLFVDGDNLSGVLSPGADLSFSPYLPAAIAYDLQPDADILILEPKGGMDILAASYLGANYITAVESNPLIIKAADWIYQSPDVEVIVASGRSYMAGTRRNFDIIQLPLTDSYHPISSGAYALGEDYRYTVEAFIAMIRHLNPDGLLITTRWLQEDPSEYLRIFTLGVTALESEQLSPSTQIIALRGYNTGTLLIKKSPFTQTEIDKIRQFSEEKAFDLVFGPGLSAAEINRYNILPKPVYSQAFNAFFSAENREEFYKNYAYDVTPPTDDHPFFGHYFKWEQFGEILSDFGSTWQPFGGAGYLVILTIFLIALVLADILILLPVGFIKRNKTHGAAKEMPFYFGLIGLGFMLVEMPLIQRFILYLDQPAFAFAIVLASILLFSGLGSRFGSQKISLSRSMILLILTSILVLGSLPVLIKTTLGIPFLWRLVITIFLIAPLGFLMGIPFPGGLFWMHLHNQHLSPGNQKQMISWVWAINGAASVVASILASLLALSWGFTRTAFLGVGCYLIAWFLVIKPLSRQNQVHN